MQKKFNKKNIINIFLIVIVLFLIVVLLRLFKIEKIGKISKLNKNAETQELFDYYVYDNQDSKNIKLIVKINSENGIEYIKKPEGSIIEANGKNNITIDYVAAKDAELIFKIKENNKEEVNKVINLTEKAIEKSINIEKEYEVSGYRNLKIISDIELEGYKSYYQIGPNGNWIEGNGNFSIIDYDIYRSGLLNDDDTLTINAKTVNENFGNTVLISKKYSIDKSETISNYESNSIIETLSKNDISTGLYDVTVADTTYSLKVYNYNGDLNIKANTTYGLEEDVGNKTEQAKNMIVLKIDGNLTIDENTTLTAYKNSQGYGGPKGFFVYCTGKIINNGLISMDNMGAKATGENVYLWQNTQYETENKKYEYIPATGATGGAKKSGSSTSAQSGAKGSNGNSALDSRKTGGGGSGGIQTSTAYQHASSGVGGTGISYRGGNGSAGKCCSTSVAGNSLGGGLLVIKTNELYNGGTISSNGYNGNKKGYVSGGSSGGGSINIFSELITKKGNITANGGKRLSISYSGGAGGKGCISIGSIATGTYQESAI